MKLINKIGLGFMTSVPIILSLLVGGLLTAKLFNMDVKFNLLDYTLIGVWIWVMYQHFKEQFALKGKWKNEK